MSLFINREESIIMSRGVKLYIRLLEKALIEARNDRDDKKERLIKKRIVQATKLVKKAGNALEETSKLFLIVDDEFRA